MEKAPAVKPCIIKFPSESKWSEEHSHPVDSGKTDTPTKFEPQICKPNLVGVIDDYPPMSVKQV